VPEKRLRRILLADNDEDVLVALERTLEDGDAHYYRKHTEQNGTVSSPS
jgi:hypothetical protein